MPVRGAEIIGVFREWPEDRHSGFLALNGFVQVVDPEMFFIPFRQTARSAALKNTPPIPMTFAIGFTRMNWSKQLKRSSEP